MLAPWGPPLVVQFADIVWKHTLNNSFISGNYWKLVMRMINYWLWQDLVKIWFTQVLPILVHLFWTLKTQPNHCNFVIASEHITREVSKAKILFKHNPYNYYNNYMWHHINVAVWQYYKPSNLKLEKIFIRYRCIFNLLELHELSVIYCYAIINCHITAQ